MTKEIRRTEWGDVAYSKPVSQTEHRVFVNRMRALGQWEELPLPERDEKPNVSPKISIRPVSMTKTGAEYYFASLILEGLPYEEVQKRMNSVIINTF